MRQLINRSLWIIQYFRHLIALGKRVACIGFIAYIIAFVQPAVVSAQEISAALKADSSAILIGDYLHVRLTVRFSKDLTVTMPLAKDTVGTMELVKLMKTDTAVDENFITYSQAYILSAYDSGLYRAGPQKVLFKNKDGIADSLFSDTLLIHVTTIPVDTAKAFKAIKEPLSVAYSLSEFIPVIIAGLLLIALLLVLFYFYRRRKNRKPVVVERARPKDPPHVWARKELKKLEEEKLWQLDEIKKYYSRLTDILRLYLEYRYGWLALESTTEKIREDISQYTIHGEAKDDLLNILQEGDLVKFAKSVPLPELNSKLMEKAYRFIDLTAVNESRESNTNV